MLDVKIGIGGVDVFATGVLIVQNDVPIRLEPFGPESTYFLELRFIQSELPYPAFRNFNEGLGHVVVVESLNSQPVAVTNTSPLFVAQYRNRKVLAIFSIEALGTTPITRSVIYTLLDGGAIT